VEFETKTNDGRA